MMNKILINELITRQIDLLRYEKTVRNDVLALLDFMQSNIQTQLFSGSLNAQIEHIENIIKNGYASILKILDVLPVLDTEMMWLAATLGGLAAAYKLKDKIIPFTQKKLKDLAEKFTVGGLTLPETLAKQQNDLTAKIKAWLRQAKIDDITPDLSELGDLFSHAKNTAKTMTRTWINSVAHTAHDAFAKINPMIKGFRHLSVLDGTTTAVCTHRNGLLWDKKHNPIGHTEIFKRPPLHPNCRSQIVYVYDLDEPFNGFTGSDWVQSRSLNQLQEQFGKGIGQMLFDGKIQLHEALDGLKPLTLEQLQDKLSIPETIRAIERKNWADEFKEKAKSTYYDFKHENIELDSHFIARLLDRNSKHRPIITSDDVKQFILSNQAKYIQEDGRLVWIDDKMKMTLIQSSDDGMFVTLMRKNSVKSTWKQI